MLFFDETIRGEKLRNQKSNTMNFSLEKEKKKKKRQQNREKRKIADTQSEKSPSLSSIYTL